MEDKIAIESLKYIFSPTEKSKLSQELAKLVCDKINLKSKKDVLVAQIAGEMKEIDQDIINQARKIIDGYEFRDIECKVIPDMDNREWLYIRSDTGEIAREREMTKKEWAQLSQRELPIDKQEDDTETGEMAGQSRPPNIFDEEITEAVTTEEVIDFESKAEKKKKK